MVLLLLVEIMATVLVFRILIVVVVVVMDDDVVVDGRGWAVVRGSTRWLLQNHMAPPRRGHEKGFMLVVVVRITVVRMIGIMDYFDAIPRPFLTFACRSSRS